MPLGTDSPAPLLYTSSSSHLHFKTALGILLTRQGGAHLREGSLSISLVFTYIPVTLVFHSCVLTCSLSAPPVQTWREEELGTSLSPPTPQRIHSHKSSRQPLLNALKGDGGEGLCCHLISSNLKNSFKMFMFCKAPSQCHPPPWVIFFPLCFFYPKCQPPHSLYSLPPGLSQEAQIPPLSIWQVNLAASFPAPKLGMLLHGLSEIKDSPGKRTYTLESRSHNLNSPIHQIIGKWVSAMYQKLF